MSLIVKKTYSAPAPEGLHNAVCCDVVDLGMKRGAFGEQDKVRLIFQLETVNPKAFSGPEPYRIMREYNKSLSEKSSLRKDLKSWRGKDFTREELEGFDLEKLIGVNAQIQVIHTMSELGGTFGNIAAIVPPARNSVPLKPVAYIRVKDRPKSTVAIHPAPVGPPNTAPVGRSEAEGPKRWVDNTADDDIPF